MTGCGKRLLVLLVLAVSAIAQTPNASISGSVADPTRALLPGARVGAKNVETNVEFTSTTNAEGFYVLANLAPGKYVLQVQKDGFRTIVKPDVVLHIQDAVELNFSLAVGSSSETVTVEGGAPLLNTESSAVSTVIDRQMVENMPLNGRSLQTLFLLTPGVTQTNEQGQFSVNGQRTDANYVTIDGVSANIGTNTAATGGTPFQVFGGSVPGFNIQGSTSSLVSVDALQEFRIQTSGFAPEFGRTPGGQVSLLTRSGTNQWHGTASEYLRNDVLDANDWFSDHNGVAKPKDRQNDFGGVFGGPIIKDKTFFFFSYEGLRLRQPQAASTTVPSLSARTAASAAVAPLLNMFPIPNGADLGNGTAPFNSTYSNPSSLDTYGFRLDQAITSKLNFFARYSYSRSLAQPRTAQMLSNVANNQDIFHTFTAGLNQVFSNRITNELRANYSNDAAVGSRSLDTFGGATPLPDSAVFPSGFTSANSDFLLTLLPISATPVFGQIGANEQRVVNVLDNVSIVTGAHAIKFGVDYRWMAPFHSNSAYSQFVEFTSILGPSGALAGKTALASIIAGGSYSILQKNFSLYGQDTWKATPRLTLTFGLRWDVNPALTGHGSASTPIALLPQGSDSPLTLTPAPFGAPLYATTWGNVAPRIGAAYQLRTRPGRETVLRGGYGIFYDLGDGQLGSQAFPFGASETLLGLPYPFTAAQAAPPAISRNLPTSSNTIVSDPNLQMPKTYQWNFAIEQALGANQTLSATYVGAAGRNLLRVDNSLSGGNPIFTGNVSITRSVGTSDYDALQLQYQRRFAHGLEAIANYTWQHSIDDASSDGSSTTTTPAAFSAPGVDRGSSDFDVRHTFTGSVTYDVPFPGSNKVLHGVFGNWSLDDLVIARTAQPVNLIGTNVTIGGSTFNRRPNLIAGIPLYLFGPQFPGGMALNFTANQGGPGCKGPFCPNTSNGQGSLGRNALRGFGMWQTNFAVRRQVHLTDKLGLQFRAEFFNLFNHPNFGPPITSLASALFGQSTQTFAATQAGATGLSSLYQIGGPRSIQFVAKLSF